AGFSCPKSSNSSFYGHLVNPAFGLVGLSQGGGGYQPGKCSDCQPQGYCFPHWCLLLLPEKRIIQTGLRWAGVENRVKREGLRSRRGGFCLRCLGGGRAGGGWLFSRNYNYMRMKRGN